MPYRNFRPLANPRKDRTALAFISVWALILTVDIAFCVAVVWVAAHFISKFW